jgi:cytochrome c oxidase assembly protein subunit 15
MRVHRFAVATALATFCLLIAGGLVSTTESGLACPDWPLCEGKLIPKMVDGKQFEHTHRLVASAVAAMTFVLCAWIFRRRRGDRVLTRLGASAAVLVVVQALLGALTVKLALPVWVSSLHQATAMAFFGLTVTLAFLTRQRMPGFSSAPMDSDARSRLRRWILPVIAITYLQVCGGAVMRHTRAGLACGFDFPLCLGKLWPMDARLFVQIHMLHRFGGFLVAAAVIALAAAVLRSQARKPVLRATVVLASVTVVAQIALGIATILTSRELITMTIHSSLGAALLANLVAVYWVACPSAPPALLGLGMGDEAAASLETA